MADIFVCYPRKDQDRVLHIVNALKSDGWDVFFDEATPGGVDWRKYIHEELENAKCLIVMVSAAMEQSHWMNEEINYFQKLEDLNGRGRAHRILPLFLDNDIDRNQPYLFGINSYQSIAFFNWKGKHESPSWKRLAEVITGWAEHSQDASVLRLKVSRLIEFNRTLLDEIGDYKDEIKQLNIKLAQTETGYDRERKQLELDLIKQEQQFKVKQFEQELYFRMEQMSIELEIQKKKIEHAQYITERELRIKENATRTDQIQLEINRIETEKTPLKNELGKLEQQLESKNILANIQNQEIEKNGLEPHRLYQNVEKKKKLLNDAYDNLERLFADDDTTEQSKEDAQKIVNKRKNELKEAKEKHEQSSNHQSEPLLKLSKTQQEIAELSYQKNACQAKLQGLDAELDKWRELRRQLIGVEEKHG